MFVDRKCKMFCKRILELSCNRVDVLRDTFEVYEKLLLNRYLLNYEFVFLNDFRGLCFFIDDII